MAEVPVLDKKHFYDYLRSQFDDIESAKAFAQKWATSMHQDTPGFGPMTCREMAAHISNVLEGIDSGDDSALMLNFNADRYGIPIIKAMWQAIEFDQTWYM
jgi:hypothetical protein